VYILGVDPASKVSGYAICKDGDISEYGIWKANEKHDLPSRLSDWAKFLRTVKAKRKFTHVVVLQSANPRNFKTVRKLNLFEAIPILLSAEWNSEFVSLRDSQARKKALNNGSLKKEQVYEILSKGYKLRAFSDGGGDESDAIVAAIAGYKISLES
jgi:Holliday junction resolvasome RuvABC endonuclease subunit